MKTVPARTAFQGVAQIARFNRRAYLVAVVAVTAALVASVLVPLPLRLLLVLGAVPPAFWIASSLIVSYYVYDRSPLYDFHWIARMLPHLPRHVVNIHSGFDETSPLLSEAFSHARLEVIDIFDAAMMTEPSIAIARRVKSNSIPALSVRYDALPYADGTFDAAFVIFSAHELRRHPQRVALFAEIARVLIPDGNMILVEHTRGLVNFLAYGPGVFHFFSRQAWRRAAFDAGLIVQSERSMTPFIHAWRLGRAA